MYKLILILSGLLLLLSSPLRAAVITAGSCENSATYPHVQNAVNAARDGDTVMIPACAKTVWTSPVTVPNTKSLTIHGAGIGVTTISYSYQGFALIANVGANKIFKLAGLTLTSESGVDPGITYAVVQINASGSNASSTARFRVYNVVFDYPDTRCLSFNNIVGVVDGVVFNKKCNKQGFEVFNGSWNGVGDKGHNKWFQNYSPSTFWGTEDAVYFEDCTFYSDNSCGTDSFTISDCDRAGRYVVRYSSITNANIGAHDVGTTGGSNVGCMSAEIYNNRLYHQARGKYTAINARGGNWLIYKNGIDPEATGNDGFESLALFRIWRATSTSDCGARGVNCWMGGCYEDVGPKFVCSSLIPSTSTDCTTAGARDQTKCSVGESCLGPIDDPTGEGGVPGKGYPCLGQAGWLPARFGNSLTRMPSYLWDNTGTRSNVVGGVTGYVEINRDYCMHSPETSCGSMPGWAYTPYTYPHPLRGGPPSPRNLRIIQ